MELRYKKEANSNPILKEVKGVPYLEYPMLRDTHFVKHGFSTRFGGVSKGIYASMNLSFIRGDEREAVEENFKRMTHAIGVPYESLVASDQTHTTNVRVVTKEDCGNGITREKNFFDTDGLITNEKGITLATFYADCVPLFFLDPIHKAIGLSHSGWRGTVGKIGKSTIQKMKEEYGTKSEELLVAIGPSICMDCYEVSEDVAIAFQKEFWDTTHILFKKGNGKYQLDLWEANRQVLLEEGVPLEQISMPNLCTCCNSSFLFSHRASQGKRGNLGAFLALV